MKYIGLLLTSIGVFLVILINLYYNSITLDIQMMKDYILESNIILEDVIEKEEYVYEKEGEYISRLISIKKGIEKSKTSFLVNDYKQYRIKSIDNLIQSVSNRKDKEKYLEEVKKYNELSQKELDQMLDSKFSKVTNLTFNTYN